MRNIKIVCEYDGTDFNGFQVQPQVRTVQGCLIEAVERILNHRIKMVIAARTDSGVHATGQVVNFFSNNRMPFVKMKRGLNAILPDDIAITDIVEMPREFHSRFSAVSRSYVFSIHNSVQRSAFKRRNFLHIAKPLNAEMMFAAAETLVGERDFSSFRAAADASRHSIRRMIKAGGWKQAEDIFLFFEANAFLQHMVRNMVGTLLLVGSGRLNVEQFKAIVQAKNRGKAGPTATPHGLCLMGVGYPEGVSQGLAGKSV